MTLYKLNYYPVDWDGPVCDWGRAECTGAAFRLLRGHRTCCNFRPAGERSSKPQLRHYYTVFGPVDSLLALWFSWLLSTSHCLRSLGAPSPQLIPCFFVVGCGQRCVSPAGKQRSLIGRRNIWMLLIWTFSYPLWHVSGEKSAPAVYVLLFFLFSRMVSDVCSSKCIRLKFFFFLQNFIMTKSSICLL